MQSESQKQTLRQLPPKQVRSGWHGVEPIDCVQAALSARGAIEARTHTPVAVDMVVSTSHCKRTQPVFVTGSQTGTLAGGAHVPASPPLLVDPSRLASP